MKKALTPKQLRVYKYFITNGGYNLAKTAKHFSNSLSTIHSSLQALVYKGWLTHNKWQKPAYQPIKIEMLEGKAKIKAVEEFFKAHPEAIEMWNQVEDYRKAHNGNLPPQQL